MEKLLAKNSPKTELVNCVKSLYLLGHTTAVSGNHSVRFNKNWMWITPSGIPRYNLKTNQLKLSIILSFLKKNVLH